MGLETEVDKSDRWYIDAYSSIRLPNGDLRWQNMVIDGYDDSKIIHIINSEGYTEVSAPYGELPSLASWVIYTLGVNLWEWGAVENQQESLNLNRLNLSLISLQAPVRNSPQLSKDAWQLINLIDLT